MSARELHCDVCEGVQPFEAPPCADGHGADCPELICTRCGTALLIATFAFPAPRLAATTRPRPPARRAA
ncbi:hypothetical protein [Micromonospora globbae]|uniref:Uncharacterized protein n=1 Tax=Micromonospora globbae TaxID=1894969 RepID=A0A420F612_9ACTN|nr:hypothetical protein [Micromonospora globbae]RKF28355.1 hypothetical protein D7I43_04835 [Micromonospora globbae]WTF84803.1 hypothetical protein OH732_24305 [Micromonospora globbae]